MNHYNLEYKRNEAGQKIDGSMEIVNQESNIPVGLFAILVGSNDGNSQLISRANSEETYEHQLTFSMYKNISEEDFANLDGLTNTGLIRTQPVYGNGESPNISEEANNNIVLLIICKIALAYDIMLHSTDKQLNKDINEAYFILDAFEYITISSQTNGSDMVSIETDITPHVLDNVYSKSAEDFITIGEPKMPLTVDKLIKSRKDADSFVAVWKTFVSDIGADSILLGGSIGSLSDLNKYALVSLNHTFDSTDYTKAEIDLIQSILYQYISEIFTDDVFNVNTSQKRIAFGIELIYTLMSNTFTTYIKENILSECEGDQSLLTGKLEDEISYIIGRTLVHLHGMLSRNVYYTN